MERVIYILLLEHGVHITLSYRDKRSLDDPICRRMVCVCVVG